MAQLAPVVVQPVQRDRQVRLVLGLRDLPEVLDLQGLLVLLGQRVRVLAPLAPQVRQVQQATPVPQVPQEQGPLGLLVLRAQLVPLVEDLLVLLDRHPLLRGLRVLLVRLALRALLAPQGLLAHPAVAARHSG